MDVINVTKAIEFVMSCCNPDGGFGNSSKYLSHLQNVTSLMIFNSFSRVLYRIEASRGESCWIDLLLRWISVVDTATASHRHGETLLVVMWASAAERRLKWAAGETARCVLFVVGFILAHHHGTPALDQLRSAGAIHSIVPRQWDRRFQRSHR